MSNQFTNRQREAQYQSKGRPVLSLEFDVFVNNDVSMWTHTRHDIPFTVMKQAFEAIKDHIERFIADENMCPFNPYFVQNAVDDETIRDT